MKTTKNEKLVNFCDKLIIKSINANRGLASYFEYKDKQYYASFIFSNETGPDFAVFPALDKSVTSWKPLYKAAPNTLDKESFKYEVFNFIFNV